MAIYYLLVWFTSNLNSHSKLSLVFTYLTFIHLEISAQTSIIHSTKKVLNIPTISYTKYFKKSPLACIQAHSTSWWFQGAGKWHLIDFIYDKYTEWDLCLHLAVFIGEYWSHRILSR